MLKINISHKHSLKLVIRSFTTILLLLFLVVLFSFDDPQVASAQVCYSEGVSGSIIACTGTGAGDLTADKCYVKAGLDGPDAANPNLNVFTEVTCPTGIGNNLTFTPPETVVGTDTCGSGEGSVSIAIDVGCDPEGNAITAYANAIINFLAAGVGIVVIIMVAIGGVQYMAAGGNPQQTQAAIKRITDAFIGLFFFLFLYAFLQWIIPGGALNSTNSGVTDTTQNNNSQNNAQ